MKPKEVVVNLDIEEHNTLPYPSSYRTGGPYLTKATAGSLQLNFMTCQTSLAESLLAALLRATKSAEKQPTDGTIDGAESPRNLASVWKPLETL